MGRAIEAEPVLHPAAGEEWFKALPKARQEEFHQACRAEIDQENQGHKGILRGYRESALKIGLIFAVFDWLSPGGDFSTFLTAFVVGAVVGLFLERIWADRLISGAVGTAAFFVSLWVLRDGLCALHMFMLFPPGALCGVHGALREIRD